MMTDANAILLVMQNPREGQDSAHRDWYLAHHLPDVCGVPGVLRGEFAGTTDRLEGLRWTNAAAYWLDGDPAAILGEIFQRAGSRSEEPPSELQSLMSNSYAVFCLQK